MGWEGWKGNGPTAALQLIRTEAAVLAALAPALGHGCSWGQFQPLVPADALGAGVHAAGKPLVSSPILFLPGGGSLAPRGPHRSGRVTGSRTNPHRALPTTRARLGALMLFRYSFGDLLICQWGERREDLFFL